jgi:hypothetical protein
VGVNLKPMDILSYRINVEAGRATLINPWHPVNTQFFDKAEQFAAENIFYTDAPDTKPGESYLGIEFGDGVRMCWDSDLEKYVVCAQPSYCTNTGYIFRSFIGQHKEVSEGVKKDASYYEILSNLPGKNQQGINVTLLTIWGEVEKWYGDPSKRESCRDFLLRLQQEFKFEYAGRELNQFQTIDSLHHQTQSLAAQLKEAREENKRLKKALKKTL